MSHARMLRELEGVRVSGQVLKRLEDYRDAMMELEDLEPEELHRIYKLLRLSVRFRPYRPLEISGIFAEVAEEAEIDLSYCCKLPPLGV